MDTPQIEQKESVFREVHLRDYWKIVWQGRWTVLAIFVVVVGVTAVWTFLQTPLFRATATIEVQPKANQLAAGQDVSGLGAAGYGWFAEEKYHNTQVEIIKSRDVARRVVEKLGLAAAGSEFFPPSTDPNEVPTSEEERVRLAADRLRGMLQVVPRRETGLIEISMIGRTPDNVRAWVNVVAEIYVERNIERAQANMKEAVATINSQLEDLQSQLRDAEEKRFDSLTEQAREFAVFNPAEQEEIVRDQLKFVNSELTKVKNDLSHLMETLGQFSSLPTGGDPMSLPSVAEDQLMADLYHNKVELEREIERMKHDLRPSHPDYVEATTDYAKVEERMTSRAGEIWSSLRSRRDLLQKKQDYLEAQLDHFEEFSMNVLKASSKHEVVNTSSETKRRVFDVISKTLNEVQLQSQFLTNNVSVLDQAVMPRYAIKPRKRVNLAIGALMGMFLGLAAAFFLDYLDNTFRTPEDIEKYLKAAVLGVIPKLDSDGLKNRAAKEAYQSLRTSLIFSSKNRQRKLILITSTGPQEGKSSTVANVGRTLASTGDRVLIIDCDLRRPTQHDQHEIDREFGVTNYLAAPLEDTDWRQYVKSAGPASLHLLSCGPLPPSPPELLGSEKFTALLDAAREQYDWILIDSPPAASLADASLLAEMVDMMVLVVRHNHTDRDLVSKTLQRLRAVNTNLAGVVLNNVDLDRAYNKDYYYAGYYYYGAEGERKQRKGRRKNVEDKKANVG